MNYKTIPEHLDFIISEYGDVFRVRCQGKTLPTRRKIASRLGGRAVKYLYVWLRENGRTSGCRVNRLVLMAFKGPPPAPSFHCAHMDGNPLNNHISNLAWMTTKDNCAQKLIHGTQVFGSKSHRAKLNEAQVTQIRAMLKDGVPTVDIASQFHVDRSSINYIRRRVTWSHIP